MWSRFSAFLGVRELLALIGDIGIVVSVFVPWIYAFSAPVGPDLKVTLVAAPDLVGLIASSDYGYLVIVPIGLVLGALFVVTPRRRHRTMKIGMIAAAFALTLVGNFAFGSQYGGSIGLIMNGQYVSYSTSLGPGSRVVELATALYFFSLLISLWSED